MGKVITLPQVGYPAEFLGRRVIYSDAEKIDDKNVIEELQKAILVHSFNSHQINYLYRYYLGRQPILDKVKLVREEINHKVVENHANKIVSFKTGYLIGEPVQYVSSDGDESLETIKSFNKFMKRTKKKKSDKKLVEWGYICGTGYRLALPGTDAKNPVKIATLDPRYAFVVYRNDTDETPLMGVKYIVRQDGKVIYSVYTEGNYYEIEGNMDIVTKAANTDKKKISTGTMKIAKAASIITHTIPIIEYPMNNARLGAFEIVLTLLDAINEVESGRVDGVDSFVQALMMFKGADISEEIWDQIKDMGAFSVPPEADAKYLTQELNQSQTQTLVENMYHIVDVIVGMPSFSDGNSSDSSNNGAIILKNGWEQAEAKAKDDETMFEASELDFLNLATYYVNALSKIEIDPVDIEVRFTRRNYENITEKTNVLRTMLGTDMIDPKLAFEHCGLFADPDLAYKQSMEYYKTVQQQEKEDLERADKVAKDAAKSQIGLE